MGEKGGTKGRTVEAIVPGKEGIHSIELGRAEEKMIEEIENQLGKGKEEAEREKASRSRRRLKGF